MSVETLQDGTVCILKIGENELKDAQPFVQTIQAALQEGNKSFLVDLSEVSYISSYVLGSFVTTFRNVQEHKGELKFVNVQPCVSNMFEMTRLNRIFEFFTDRETALKSFHTKSN